MPDETTSNNLWNAVLNHIRRQVGAKDFETWLRPIRFYDFDASELVVAAPTDSVREWVQEHYGTMIAEALHRIEGRPLSFTMLLDEGLGSFDQRPAGIQRVQPKRLKPKLNAKYTFQSFVVGPSNQFANAAALAVAELPAAAYNPLFVYGGVGLGKTHLMHAIGHYLSESDKPVNVLYITAESFMTAMITAIRYDKMTEFRDNYRNVDVLLIDDIHFLSGKERTQEEFFHTFNALYDAHKQIVISSDRLPSDIDKLEERLRSRFKWGLIADIQIPDLETKIAILHKKAELERIPLTTEVAYFIAENVKSNVRELEGCLLRIGAFASLTGREINMELARETLAHLIDQPGKAVDVPQIQKIVAAHFDIPIAAMRSKKRTRQIAYPRQIAMYLARELTPQSLKEIGLQFGGKDHSTVVYAHQEIAKRLKASSEARRIVDKLTQQLKG
jgi:chromosomal replication initiator protein